MPKPPVEKALKSRIRDASCSDFDLGQTFKSDIFCSRQVNDVNDVINFILCYHNL